MRLKLIPTTYLLIRVLLSLGALGFLTATQYSPLSVGAIIVCLVGYAIVAKRLDYLDPFVVFMLPWLLILAFTLVPLSNFAKPIHQETYRLVFLALFSGLIVAGGGSLLQRKATEPGVESKRMRLPLRGWLFFLEALFVSLTLLNIFLAGYIPLIQGILTGDTGYTEFGVHGLYGFYLAFANALGLFYFFLYLRTKKFSYLFRYLSIHLVFILFVTRQNTLSMTLESLAVYSLVRGRIRWHSIVAFLGCIAVLFSVAGSLRSGKIKELAEINDQYLWVPEPMIWVYAYSYFNIANVDKLITTSGAPFYDGSSISALVPSFLRPTYDTENYLEVTLFNVSSFLYPMYQDVGTSGVVLLTVCMLGATATSFKRAKSQQSFKPIAIYAVLYFCAMFSFFVNFWTYLPVIFQLAFFPFFSKLADRVMRESTQAMSGNLMP